MSLSVCEHCGKPVEQVTYWRHVGEVGTYWVQQTPPPPVAAAQIFVADTHTINPIVKEG